MLILTITFIMQHIICMHYFYIFSPLWNSFPKSIWCTITHGFDLRLLALYYYFSTPAYCSRLISKIHTIVHVFVHFWFEFEAMWNKKQKSFSLYLLSLLFYTILNSIVSLRKLKNVKVWLEKKTFTLKKYYKIW